MIKRLLTLFTILLFILTTGISNGQTFKDGLNAYNKKDYKRTFEIFKHLAEQGDKIAQDKLGLMYEIGEGTTQSFQETAIWHTKSAKQGLAKAQTKIGLLYETGLGRKFKAIKKPLNCIQKRQIREKRRRNITLARCTSMERDLKKNLSKRINGQKSLPQMNI